MRKLLSLVTGLICLLYSTNLRAEAVDIVASAHGVTCDDAKAALRDVVNNGSDQFTLEQSQTHQFPTAASAVKFCQVNQGANAPYAGLPDINDSDTFALPTEIKENSGTCSYLESGGVRTYGVGWTGTTACNL